MSKILNDTIHAASHGVESAKEGTMHALDSAKDGLESAQKSTMHTVTNALSLLVKGASAAAAIVSTVRRLDRDDGLAWFGLARRRSPFVSVAMFGAGAVAGASVALLFAPSSGADLRSWLLGRSKAEIIARKVGDEVVDTAKKIETGLEDTTRSAVSAVKDVAGDVKRAATGVAKNHDPATA